MKGKEGWIWGKYSVHMYLNRKMVYVETIPGMGEVGRWRKYLHYIQVWYIWYIVRYILRTFINGTMYTLLSTIIKNQNKKK
jgi:hypothetical protein